MTVTVVATIYPKPEDRQAVIDAFAEIIGKVHTEDGCELYTLHEGEDRLVMIEKWASPEALQVHDKGPALAELGAALNGKLSGPIDLQILTPHPAGDQQKGVL
jgi:quinol monooxygenase YgiN